MDKYPFIYQMVKANVPQVDMSLESWISNTHEILQFPVTILTVVILLVIGAFTEIAPRKSLEFLDNTPGMLLLFILPIILASSFDWATGMLAAVICLIVFTRLQKIDMDEGFVDSTDDTMSSSTKIISNPHRWFVEKILGESPIAISSDRVVTRVVEDENTRTTSLNSTGSTSNGTSTSSHGSSSSLFDQFNSSSSNK